MPKPKHILVIRLSAMGDVAMTVPVLNAFTEQYPNVKLTILTKGHFTPFFRDLKNVSVFEADIKGKHKGIFGLWKLAKTLKQLNIDATADLHNVLRSNILKWLLPKPFVQIDKGRAEKRELISGKQFNQLKSSHQRYVEVFETLGFTIDLSKPSFPDSKQLNESLESITGNKVEKWIGIAPFAAYESKMYPLPKMNTIIETLSKESKIFLFGGGREEIEMLDNIESSYSNVISLAGKLKLEEELDVISNLDLMLSMDSGNGHIAAMLGIPVITIWGVTHPFAGFKPFNQPIENSLVADKDKYPLIPTSIYGNKYPPNYKASAGSISENKIIEKVKSLL